MSQYSGVARTMIEQFGLGPIPIDKFDDFIIQQGMADDPETSETNDPRHRAFIQNRATCRNRLNAGARALQVPFSIGVDTPGKTYELREYSQGAVEDAKATMQRVDLFSSNKVKAIDKSRNQMAALLELNPDSLEIKESKLMLDVIALQADSLGVNFKAQIAQFNAGMAAVEAHVQATLERLRVAQLTGPDSE